MPKRISKTKRKLQRLQRAVAAGLQSAQGNYYDTPIGRWPPEQREAYVREWAEGNLTTGPERTPLKPWTPEQVEAYKQMRLEDAREHLLRVTKPMTDADAAAADAEHERRWDRFFKDGPR
jgi:hypothetical protein